MSIALDGTRSSHRWAEPPGNFDALNCRAIYPSGNEWGIPDLFMTKRTPARLVAYGYDRAVANLRSLAANFHPAGEKGVLLTDAVRYLDATKETTHG